MISSKKVRAFIALPIVSITILGFLNTFTNPSIAQSSHSNMIAQLPTPTGIYINYRSRQFFFGDYNNTGRPEYAGVVWEVRVGQGNVVAKGYGNIPRGVIYLIRTLFMPIRAS
jgi:hypothetical protein